VNGKFTAAGSFAQQVGGGVCCVMAGVSGGGAGVSAISTNKLQTVVSEALDKVIKNAAWRKHGKLVQDCKAALEKLASSSSEPEIGVNGGGGGAESPLFDDKGQCYKDVQAEIILLPLISACETAYPKVVEPALDCLQKLIAHGHLRGEMDTLTPDSKLLLQVMDAVCRCYDMADEGIELLVLKTLLTAVTSMSLRVHGDCLLKAVRTCYNLFLGSKSAVNQTTAKASLTQMLVIVFRRMEADSSTVTVIPITIADLMEPAEIMTSDTNVTQFVQSFITKVVQDIEVVLTPVPALKGMQHDGAFDATATESSSTSDILESTDKDMLDARYWEISMYKNAIDQGRKVEINDAIADKDGDLEVQITNKLRRDAFLVFRALCKLSMKNAPQEAVADPFSIRGKIIALELLKILLENAGTVFRTSDRYPFFLGVSGGFPCFGVSLLIFRIIAI
jgi:brefeldin A-inhibited guanine nucleotide-exchange protein